MGSFLGNLIHAIAAAFIVLVVLIGLGDEATMRHYSGTGTTSESSHISTSTEGNIGAKEEISTTTPQKTEEMAPTIIPVATTTIKATSTPKVEKPKEGIKITIAKEPTVSSPTAPIPTTSEVNELTREASVNILCTTSSSGDLHPITGSGTIIDSRGVILTNAHIGQYFLLKNFPTPNNVDCVIRTGSPAVPHYRGELLYISPQWIESNKENIKKENPLGTGENDFALIAITESTNINTPLPTSFPSLPVNIEEMDANESLIGDYVIAGYPAGFLGGISVLKDLFISSTIVQAKQVYTFKDYTVDLLSFPGNILAQKGASGSAVVRKNDKKIVGIIVTTTTAENTGDRELRAVTTSHLNRSLLAETGKSIPEFLTGSLRTKIIEFNINYFSALKKKLTDQFN